MRPTIIYIEKGPSKWPVRPSPIQSHSNSICCNPSADHHPSLLSSSLFFLLFTTNRGWARLTSFREISVIGTLDTMTFWGEEPSKLYIRPLMKSKGSKLLGTL